MMKPFLIALMVVWSAEKTDGEFKRGRPGECLLPADRLQQPLPGPEPDMPQPRRAFAAFIYNRAPRSVAGSVRA